MLQAVACVRANDIQPLKLLGGRVSVNERSVTGYRLGKTLLEEACGPQVSAWVFKNLLEDADPRRLDDVDENHRGLIHHLMEDGPEQDAKLKALLDKGAYPNLMRAGEPVLVSYILRKRHGGAKILLNKQADLTLAGAKGVNASGAASWTDDAPILDEIKSIEGPDFDWVGAVRSPDNSSQHNAIQLAMMRGSKTVIQFYSSLGLVHNTG